MDRPADAFRTISEVADDLDLPQHVLRFWETRFTQIKPLKRGGGRRYYRPDDVELLRAIRHLLYGEGYTIRGVQRILKEQGVKAVIGLVRAGASDGAAVSGPATASAHGPGVQQRSEPTMGTLERDADDASLSPAHLDVLHAALAELAECARILQAARN
ncbi:MAG: MerR family transcriptional regulator [Hyphomicrobiales bacterium]|nr:MerR family transcriptional regulator [Hyphomicrobiales bacterium]